MSLAVWNRGFLTHSERSIGCIWHHDFRSVFASATLRLDCFESASQRLSKFVGIEMATITQSMPNSTRRSAWIWEFLKEEIIPYPGRGALVGRMITAATLAMLTTMTFRLPYGAYCAIYALSISRESTQITVQAAAT